MNLKFEMCVLIICALNSFIVKYGKIQVTKKRTKFFSDKKMKNKKNEKNKN